MSYPLCPRCGSGRMVPMFMSGPACDLACEKHPVPAQKPSNRYWAVSFPTTGPCVWDNKKAAVAQAADHYTHILEVELRDPARWNETTAFGGCRWFYPDECGVRYTIVEQPVFASLAKTFGPAVP